MSRVGKLPISIPSGVTVVMDDASIAVNGPKGKLFVKSSPAVRVVLNDNTLVVSPSDSSAHSRAMWGTMRSNLNNIVRGVSEGFSRKLDIRGVGYKAAINGNMLSLSLGFSHEIRYIIPEDISVTIEKQTQLEIKGIDIQKVGKTASDIRSLRKPEPYKGKGVRYSDEFVRSKEGKKK
ncbi:MAG: 50S ribosomal protein L6 [Alphaproteobacteria bacterium]|nr:MAG: 50S ribosomal protein L6 [Alphaproteobacteria bacterium]